MIPPAHRLKLYGLTEEDFILLWEKQDGRCAMCTKAFTRARPPCIDHCHATFTVRGLLCGTCNYTLGVFHDDFEWFRNTADYLNYPTADQVFEDPRYIRDTPEGAK